MGEEVKRSPTAIVDAVWRRMRKRRHETQGLGSQGLVICLDTKRTEMPADRLRLCDEEKLKAFFAITAWPLGCHGAPQLTGASLSLMQSGTVTTVFLHLPLFGISHLTELGSTCRFSVFQPLTVSSEFHRHELRHRRDAKTRRTEAAMLAS